MIRKLRIKFICINMLIVAVMMSMILGTVMFFSQQNIEERSYELMRRMSGGPGERPRPDSAAFESRIPMFTISIGEGGEISTEGGEFYDLSDEGFLETLIGLVGESGENEGEIRQYNLRFMKQGFPRLDFPKAEPFEGELFEGELSDAEIPKLPEDVPGLSAARIVFTDTSYEQNLLSSLRRTCTLIWFGGFAAFFVISVLLARWAVKPVEEAWEQQKQFIADASHELKTPLTVIMTDADLLSSPDCGDKYRGTLVSNISSMAVQMRGLVESLLDLTRFDSGAVAEASGQVDFSAAVESAVLSFEALFFESGLSLKSEVEPGITVKGNEQQLSRLASILLDNACKYCTPGTETSLSLQRKGNSCVLKVSDFGDAISPEEQKKLFKRFYRADKARAMNHSYGLGLSIAESIAAAHKGSIWCESREGVNSFLVRLPCA